MSSWCLRLLGAIKMFVSDMPQQVAKLVLGKMTQLPVQHHIGLFVVLPFVKNLFRIPELHLMIGTVNMFSPSASVVFVAHWLHFTAVN